MAYNSNDEEEDTQYYYRCPLDPPEDQSQSQKRGSGGLVPSKSTLYVGNMDYTLTNSDIFTIFSTFGKVGKVTIMKDRRSRQSKGVAFVLFTMQEDAQRALGEKINVSIATDNGRAAEFIRRRVYKDKTRCYECREPGHLSYECPRNQLGTRERPVPKRGRKGQRNGGGGFGRGEGLNGLRDSDEEVEEPQFEDDNWASVVDPRGVQERTTGSDHVGKSGRRGEGSEKKAKYFSDESGDED